MPAPAATQPFLQIKNIAKTYASARGDVTALEDISLDIQAAEFIGILGPSGCGKTTLLRCLAGIEAPSAGEIAIDGKAVAGPPDNLGVVFQRDTLLDWRTVLQNVLLPVEVYHLKTSEWRPKALASLDLLGLKGFEHRYPWELSGGMRQRVAICRALLLNPSLMLMDEPFGALDAITRDELNLELQRIWLAHSKTVVFVTHSITEAVFLADRVVVMSRSPGRIADVMEVKLARPRELAVRESGEFARLCRQARLLFEQMGLMRGIPPSTEAAAPRP
ncbi:MAG: ABC transporter ATP-binding protein [Alphaproteobacteria bacterium]|nr:MAG: ABC transporter ATP-binding protein [Alphaproteobacteria bacterium]